MAALTTTAILDGLKWLWSNITFTKKKPEVVHRPEKRILVVEDNMNDAILLENCLKGCGRTCSIAANAEAADALINRNEISIAFVDMRLLHMPGWDLVKLIWQKSPHTHVVITCGLVEDLNRLVPPLGIFTVAAKPITCTLIEELLAKIKG